MKVYQINSVCGYGSTGKIVLDLADALQANGDECRIAYGRGLCQDPRAFRFATDLGVKLHGVLSRITDRQGFYSDSATRRLIADIKAYAPDVIHLHNLHGYYLNVQTLFQFLKRYRKPIVWTLHDCWAFTGHCAYYSFAGCNRWKEGCHHCPQRKAYPSSLLLDQSLKNYRQKKELFASVADMTIITPSFWLQEQVKHSFLGHCQVETIYNGINLDIFSPDEGNVREKYSFGNKKIVLGVANIWEPRKGLQDLLSLSKRLPGEYQLVLVGLSDEQIAHLPGNVIGISRTQSTAELAQLYSAAHVYVNTSYEETMGLTTVEALACGTSVVVYDQTAVPEIVSAECGTVVAAGDIDQLCKAICSASFQADACIAHSKQFEKKQQYAKYVTLYHKVSGV